MRSKLKPGYKLYPFICKSFERARDAETDQAKACALGQLNEVELRKLIIAIIHQFRLLPKHYKQTEAAGNRRKGGLVNEPIK